MCLFSIQTTSVLPGKGTILVSVHFGICERVLVAIDSFLNDLMVGRPWSVVEM